MFHGPIYFSPPLCFTKLLFITTGKAGRNLTAYSHTEVLSLFSQFSFSGKGQPSLQNIWKAGGCHEVRDIRLFTMLMLLSNDVLTTNHYLYAILAGVRIIRRFATQRLHLRSLSSFKIDTSRSRIIRRGDKIA